MRCISTRAVAAASFLALVAPVVSHSWVEQLVRIAPNGTFYGPPGYISGYVPRNVPGFGDPMDVFQIPTRSNNSILPSDNICKPTQTIGNYTQTSPMLVAGAGDWIALRHQENGHVSLPHNQAGKPENRGTIYIYGTTQPSNDDTLLGIHNQWNANGTGGDGRGKLIATRNYDDGRCRQINNGDISKARQKQYPKVADQLQGADLWCQSDIQLPSDLGSNGTYTIYWVWEWNTYYNNLTIASRDDEIKAASSSTKIKTNEVYTSCMQIQMTDPCSDELGDVKAPACATAGIQKHAVSYIQGQDLNNAAIPDQLQTNWKIDVQGGDEASGSLPSGDLSSSQLPAATPAPSAAAASAVPAAPTPSAGSGPHNGVDIEVVTVTVTEDVETVYVTVTIGVTATVTATEVVATTTVPPVGAAASSTSQNAPQRTGSNHRGGFVVEPFQRRAVRRGAGEWQLGARR
jgi:hypothetical protein